MDITCCEGLEFKCKADVSKRVIFLGVTRPKNSNVFADDVSQCTAVLLSFSQQHKLESPGKKKLDWGLACGVSVRISKINDDGGGARPQWTVTPGPWSPVCRQAGWADSKQLPSVSYLCPDWALVLISLKDGEWPGNQINTFRPNFYWPWRLSQQ